MHTIIIQGSESNIHRRTRRVSFGGGGGVRWRLLPDIFFFSIGCPKIKWFCPNITCFLPENGYLKNSRGGGSPPLAPWPVRTPVEILPFLLGQASNRKWDMHMHHVIINCFHRQERLWRKNRKNNVGSTCVGTDLNRNYDYKWGGWWFLNWPN